MRNSHQKRSPRQPTGFTKRTLRVRKPTDLLSRNLPRFCDDLNHYEDLLKTGGEGADLQDMRTAVEIVDLLRGGHEPKRRGKGQITWREALPKAIGLFHDRFGQRAHAYLLVGHYRHGKDRPLRPQGFLRDEIPPTRHPRSILHEKGSPIALRLWQLVFNNHGYERIRRCERQQCRRFFVAWGLTHRRKHCADLCKNRRWDRPARRESKENRGRLR
jgi:hypothetical protein